MFCYNKIKFAKKFILKTLCNTVVNIASNRNAGN